MSNTIEVIGRNGYSYDAIPVSGNLFIVGKFIVRVELGHVTGTVCAATKSNLTRWS